MPTAIICRYDNANQKPVVFLVDNIDYEKGVLKAWSNNQTSDVNLAYYHTTLPLSHADNKALMQQYMNATSNPDVVLRDRLPRQTKQRPNIIAQIAQATATPQPQGKRQKQVVPNRIAPVQSVGGFTFNVTEALEATRQEFNNKIDALVRAYSQSTSQASTSAVKN